ncbi:MAG: site-specific integrase [Pseudaminobacter sp.]|nr:site-specific integrase [Pseudaminobacter sp.]
MSVRKRTWTTAKGEEKSAWIVDYVDGKGVRRLKSFKLKKQADQFAATAAVEVREGSHVADSASATVEAAGRLWIASCEAHELERSTLAQYRQHLDLHIVPLIGDTILAKLTVPAVRSFEDRLRESGRSTAMMRKVLVSLGSLLADAQERGLVIRNAVREKSRSRSKGTDRRQERRQKGKLKVGVDIPTREEVKALVGALAGRWRPLLLTAIFTGLRASELRGLRWSDVDVDRREIRVHQRADRFNHIGRPKSESGERTVPAPPIVINGLKEWRLACPNSDLDLVFPNGSGKVESLANIINRGLLPALRRAGIEGRYSGMHALRHFYASWCINRPQDGGLGLPLKVVQERMGHSSVTLTADVYSHLFPRGDDAEEMAAAERSLLS